MKKTIYIVLIIFLSFVLRVYNLGQNPPALYGDELSFAWNAWNILHTGADEYGTPYPLHFRAFNDYKAPIPVYMLVPFLKVLGMDAFSIRLPVALIGTLTVYMTYLLGSHLISKKVGLLAALLLGISSWHLHLSRGFFESTIGLFFFLTAIYYFVSAKSLRRYLLSMIFFALTLYTYFTPRMVLIIFMPFLYWWQFKFARQRMKKEIGISLGLFAILILPLVYISLFDHGLSRIEGLTRLRTEQVTAQVDQARRSVGIQDEITLLLHNKPVYWVKAVVSDYLEHFSLNFWYLSGDSSLRYFLGGRGMFYLFELPFLLIGVVTLSKANRKILLLLIGWMLIAPIPTAISGRPFAVRSLGMLPAPFYMVSTGMWVVWKKLSEQKNWFVGSSIKFLIVLLVTLSFGYYLVRYHIEYPRYSANWWGGENKDAIDMAIREQDNYNYIFLSNFYTGIDLATAVYTQQDPLSYRSAKETPVEFVDNKLFIKIGKFYIGSLDLDEKRAPSDILPPKSLYLARPEETKSAETINAIEDGRVLFYIHRQE